jgi:hypothetical protein
MTNELDPIIEGAFLNTEACQRQTTTPQALHDLTKAVYLTHMEDLEARKIELEAQVEALAQAQRELTTVTVHMAEMNANLCGIYTALVQQGGA